MATSTTAAVAIGNIATMFTTPKHIKGIPTSLTINNQGAAAHTIYLRDDFTPDPSAGTPTPGAQTLIKGSWTVGAGLTAVIDSLDLKDKDFLGVCKCYADGAEAACLIALDYRFE